MASALCTGAAGAMRRRLAVGLGPGLVAARIPLPPAALAPSERRSFGTTDGPFRYLRPKFTEKKKHFGEVMVMANVRKLLETAQDVMREPNKEFPRQFWEVLAKRCIQSIHLFKPLELAIIARAFDTHGVELKAKYDIYGPIVVQARSQTEFPGLAILVLSDVLPRRLQAGKADLKGLLEVFGRQASKVMYELSAAHAVRVLEALSQAGVRAPALCGRVARKVEAQLAVPGAFDLQDLGRAATTFAAQEHRDLPVLLGIAETSADMCEAAGSGDVAAAEAAAEVLAALETLGVDGSKAAARLSKAASAAKAHVGAAASPGTGGGASAV